MTVVVPHAGSAYAAKRKVIHANMDEGLVDAHGSCMSVVGNVFLQSAVVSKGTKTMAVGVDLYKPALLRCCHKE